MDAFLNVNNSRDKDCESGIPEEEIPRSGDHLSSWIPLSAQILTTSLVSLLISVVISVKNTS